LLAGEVTERVSIFFVRGITEPDRTRQFLIILVEDDSGLQLYAIHRAAQTEGERSICGTRYWSINAMLY
jgi:hypothetical protein